MLIRDCLECGRTFEKPPTCSMRNWTEGRRFCSKACAYKWRRGRPNPKHAEAMRGKTATPDTRVKLSEAMSRRHAEGRAHRIDNTGLRGAQTSQWKGDNITYRTAHARLTNERGRPIECEMCGERDGWLEWALKHDAAVVKVQETGTGKGLSYSTLPSDYFGVCRPCHREYDGRERDPRSGRYI